MGAYRYPIDWQVCRFGDVDSTNRWLLDQARGGAPEGLVAVAGHQTAGRGRRGRRWEAPAGTALLVSVLLRPQSLPPDRRHLCGFAVGLAAADACAEVAGVRPGLKWPNDLVVGDRKLAGVLAESEGRAVVVGLGLNLTWAPAGAAALAGAMQLRHAPSAPADTLLDATPLRRRPPPPADTLLDATPLRHRPPPPADTLLDAFLTHLGQWYGRWDEVASAHRRSCVTVGRSVRVELDGETFTGVAADVTDAGHLLVDTGLCLREVAAADVVHLRSV